MAFALVTIGLALLVSGLMGTERDLGKLLVGDFTGPNSFVLVGASRSLSWA